MELNAWVSVYILDFAFERFSLSKMASPSIVLKRLPTVCLVAKAPRWRVVPCHAAKATH